jgi:hypothetical protein
MADTIHTLTPKEVRALRYRINVRCTQADLAGWLGIAPNSLARMERGELRITAAMARLIVYTVAHLTNQSPNTLAHELLAKREQLEKKSRKKRRTKQDGAGEADRKRASTRKRP